MHYDLRTEADAPAGVGHENWKDMSQRILNVMMPDTDVPIHLQEGKRFPSVIVASSRIELLPKV